MKVNKQIKLLKKEKEVMFTRKGKKKEKKSTKKKKKWKKKFAPPMKSVETPGFYLQEVMDDE